MGLGRRSERQGERGQSFAEFAIVLPLLLMLVFGVFDLGRGMSANVTVTNAAREAARTIAVTVATSGTTSYSSCPTPTNPMGAPAAGTGQAAAWTQLADASLDLTQVSMTIAFFSQDPTTHGADVTFSCRAKTDPCSCASATPSPNPVSTAYVARSGYWVRATVTYQYYASTPLISRFLPGGATISQATTMVVE